MRRVSEYSIASCLSPSNTCPCATITIMKSSAFRSERKRNFLRRSAFARHAGNGKPGKESISKPFAIGRDGKSTWPIARKEIVHSRGKRWKMARAANSAAICESGNQGLLKRPSALRRRFEPLRPISRSRLWILVRFTLSDPTVANGRTGSTSTRYCRSSTKSIRPTTLQIRRFLQKRVAIYNGLIRGEVRQVPAIRAILPQVGSNDSLCEQLDAVAAESTGYTFYNYSFMALSTLDWIRFGIEANPPKLGGR